METFMELKYRAIQAMLECVPKEAISVVATRIQDTEASVGEKVFLFEAIGNAAHALANRQTDVETPEVKQHSSMLEQI